MAINIEKISLLDILPANIARDPGVIEVSRAFDVVLREIIAKIPQLAIISNLVNNEMLTNDLIDLLAWQLHCDFYETSAPMEVKRQLVLKSLDWHAHKGTPRVVEEIVTTAFADGRVEEWFEFNGLPYTFRVLTEAQVTDVSILHNLIDAIFSVKNTRSWLAYIIMLSSAHGDWFGGVGIYIDETISAALDMRKPVFYNGFVGVGILIEETISVKGV